MQRIAVGLLLAAAAPPASPVLAPGQWHRADTDLRALINGKVRTDLPIGQSAEDPTDTCLAPGDAASPARWLLGVGGAGCTIARADYAGGRIAIAATCPTPGGERPGTLTATGQWTPETIHVRFVSVSYGGGQTFGFNGTIDAHRTGNCAG